MDSGSDNDLDMDAATSDQPKEEKKYKRFKLNKDSIPPFELPRNFRPAAIASGKMTLETKTFFLSLLVYIQKISDFR